MPTGRRLAMLMLVLAIVGTPAVALRVLCAGRACDAGATTGAVVPFCGLPAALRSEIVAGYREGRSPDVMATTSDLDVVSTDMPNGGGRIPWPGISGSAGPEMRVPIAFLGQGVRRDTMPSGVTLDAIAPTLERIIGLRREHPEVRTGEAIPGLVEPGGPATPLIVVVAWRGLGTPDLERAPDSWPFLQGALRRGTGSVDATTGSLPLDPAATLTTIGTGALPSSHGITGTLVRENDGRVSGAWSTPDAGSVIATFADDLDRAASERARVAAIVTGPADRGIIGSGWYLDAPRDDAVVETRAGARGPAARVADITARLHLGSDRVTDVLAVVLSGPLERVDTDTAAIVAAVDRRVPDAVFVVAGTGSPRTAAGVDASELGTTIEEAIGADVVLAISAGGLFLDREVMIARSITSDRVADAMRSRRAPTGGPLFVDTYPSFAVAFSRYC
ncbi:MAG TPA: hypothetical protein VNC60_09290 [Actinomycetota bacterium]|nr:hypothetical protein [Actinomycetota bacterium]